MMRSFLATLKSFITDYGLPVICRNRWAQNNIITLHTKLNFIHKPKVAKLILANIGF
jgi:hypothetical protein